MKHIIRVVSKKRISSLRESLLYKNGKNDKTHNTGNDVSPGKKIKKPFGGKGGRKRAPTAEEQKKAEAQRIIDEIEKESDSCESEPLNISSAFNNFFYTDEKFIQQFEDSEIIRFIKIKYPNFNPVTGNESVLKKIILDILNNSVFVTSLMERYSMTIFDLFKFLFRITPVIFKGAFISKIQKAIKYKKYAAVKRHNYRFLKYAKSVNVHK